MRIFVAGGAGAIGRHLVPVLVAAGHAVTGTTRSPERATWLAEVGATPSVVDALDADAFRAAVVESRPDVVINQLTDLAGGFGPDDLVKTGRIRTEATRTLVDAALEVGARRVIAQSGAWLYADDPPPPHDESHPLRTPTDRPQDASLRGILALEPLTLSTPGIEGVVLRYGFFDGPGTAYEARNAPRPRVGVGAAARATALAIGDVPAGVYNVVEDDPEVSNRRAIEVLGWTP